MNCDDDEELIIMMASNAAAIAASYYHELNILKIPCRDSKLPGCAYIQEVLTGHNARSRESFRMDKHVFLKLCEMLNGKNLLRPTRWLTIEEQVGMFLLTISQNERNRVVQERYQHSGETVSRHFNNVLHAIVALSPEFFKKASANTPDEILNNPRFYPYFKDCVGAIDGTHIPAVVCVDDQGAYRNRKGVISQNVLAACSFDMQFQYILAGWEGSAADSRVLDSALKRENKLEVPEGKYYVVDAGYANMPNFIAPFRGVRYHLSEFRGGNRPTNAKELFNHRHSSLRNVIERTFGVVKKRFPILTIAPPYPFKTQVKLVIACCILHNHIRRENANDLLHELEDEEVENEEEDETEDGSNINLEETNLRRKANQLRRSIANQMWEEWGLN